MLGDVLDRMVRATRTDLEGAPQGAPRIDEATWKELESHAHFPRSATTVTEEMVEVPAGTFDAYRYEIVQEREGSASVTRLWFAKSLPGPPVKLVREVDGAVTLSMWLVRTERR